MKAQYLIIFLLVSIFSNSCSQDKKYQYSAGSTIMLEFPELDSPLFDIIQGIDRGARAAIYLPSNYSTDKKFPLILWLNGGDGGPGVNLRIPKKLTKNENYICVNMSLFKDSLNPLKPDSSNYWRRMGIRHKDSDIIWENYQVMLEKIFNTIPNIDTGNTFMGGFSNGAHTTAVLLSRSEMEIDKYFKNYYLVEGGGFLNNLERLKNRNIILFKSGIQNRKPMDKMVKEARKNGVNIEYITMKNTGHEFPETYYDTLMEWIDKLVK